MKEMATPPAKSLAGVNRYAYGIYLVLVAYLLFNGDMDWAITNLGIALVFDPFNPAVKWSDRPLYQKVWLLVHVSLVLAGFAYLLLR